jgi:CRISPR-associated protein Csx14
VVAALTPRQVEVLRAFACGGSPQDVAETLCVTLKTVDSHKTHILAECRAAWALPDDHWLDYHFLRERFAPFYDAPGMPAP